MLNGSLNLQQDPSKANNTALLATDIALISCDPEEYAGNFDATTVINNAARVPPRAIVLYTTRLAQCNLTGSASGNFAMLYTMSSSTQATNLLSVLHQSNGGMGAQIATGAAEQAVQNATGSNPPNSGAGGENTNQNPAGATTAVAMIILYSITGVITGLFLMIIITGAVRAHRHPERYGPRNLHGGPRQSRARGIARAMLDTIPIVKFGESESQEQTPKAVDVELANNPARPNVPAKSVNTAATSTPAERAHAAREETKEESNLETAAGPGPGPSAAAVATTDPEEGLMCSICTEEFEKGQDIRLLPCGHQFHPACVDPWLLDVSGTCPLCRIDLRTAETSVETGEGNESGVETLPPPLDPSSPATAAENTSGGRLHTLLHRLQPRTAAERIAALRMHREEILRDPSAAADQAQQQQTRWQRVRRKIRESARISRHGQEN